MFDGVTLRGAEGTIVWGYHTAAVCRSWTITQRGRAWTLSAELTRADSYKLQQRPLSFTAPRKGGFYCWPIVSCALVAPTRLSATIGEPDRA